MALKPATPVEPYADLLGELDMLLVMTVEPGFGGQKFLDLCLPKIRRARELISAAGLEVWLQVDGGVSPETIERCAEAGADVFVAGSAVYSADDPDAMVQKLRNLAPLRRSPGTKRSLGLQCRPTRGGVQGDSPSSSARDASSRPWPLVRSPSSHWAQAADTRECGARAGLGVAVPGQAADQADRQDHRPRPRRLAGPTRRRR